MKRTDPRSWPPTAFALPDSLAAIEAGRPEHRVQGELFPPEADDSRAARIRRVLADVLLARVYALQVDTTTGTRPPEERGRGGQLSGGEPA